MTEPRQHTASSGHGRCRSVAVVGIDGHAVDIEAQLGGRYEFDLQGMPGEPPGQVQDRLQPAIQASQESWPHGRVTVRSAPAALPKPARRLELGMAVAILSAAGEVPEPAPDVVFLGALEPDGRLRAIAGVLPAVLGALKVGAQRVVVPESNVDEAKMAPGVGVVGVRTLRQVLALLRRAPMPDEPPAQARGLIDETRDDA
ncbi:ATP-binding protein, partial [Phytoactinopolyspora endophytica]|uniref:ATP-binding protein n=1 Tax=Phytoactinopolyspora endophytica TaxID=1642495 RepID=UPI0013EAAA05